MKSIWDIINSDENVQLIDGAVVIENITSVKHNLAVTEIATALKNYIANGPYKVFTENVALFVNELCNDDKNYYLPDIMVVCDKNGIRDDGVHTAPRFIAEVTSEITKVYDYGSKLEMYRKIGVDEYWIVDLQRNIVVQYLLSESYIPRFYLCPENVDVISFPKLSINTSVFM